MMDFKDIPFWDDAGKHRLPAVGTVVVPDYPIKELSGEIANRKNVEDAFDYIVRHMESREQRIRVARKREKYVEHLCRELTDGTFRVRKFREVVAADGTKVRVVQAPDIYSRVGVSAVMVVVERYLYPSLIRNTAASIKGRGMHYLHNILHADMKSHQNWYSYQCDIRHFYDSIRQDVMRRVIRRYVADEIVLSMIDSFIGLLPEGLAKGLRSSQCLANMLLSDVDHIMEDLSSGLYYRYCDDMVILARSKRELWRLRDILCSMLAPLGLEIKPSEAVRPVQCGVDFLGYVDYGSHSLLRKRIKVKAARALHRVRSRRRRRELMASFKGMAWHCQARHLFKILTGKEMHNFSELGVEYMPEDGKKHFAGTVRRLAEIVNTPIVVHDYQTGVKTQLGADRCVVSFSVKDEGWDRRYKFFTTSKEMIQILEKVAEIDGGFPFATVIRAEPFDKGVKYKFT